MSFKVNYENGWEYIDECEPLEPSTCTSVGFLVEDTPDHKTIAHSLKCVDGSPFQQSASRRLRGLNNG